MSAAKYNAARTSSLSESLKRHSIQHKKYKTAEMVSITKWKFNTYPPHFCSKIRKKSAILKKVPIKVYFSLCGYLQKITFINALFWPLFEHSFMWFISLHCYDLQVWNSLLHATKIFLRIITKWCCNIP